MLKYILLGLLNYRPMSGYEMEGWINVSTGNFWHAKLSQIYATLKQLEDSRAVTSHVEPQTRRPDRRVYEITHTGSDMLAAWVTKPVTEHEVKKDGLLVKVFFHPPQEKDMLLTQLRLQLKLHQDKLAEYRQQTPDSIQEMLDDRPELALNAMLWDAARRFGERYEVMYVQWLEETIEMVASQLP